MQAAFCNRPIGWIIVSTWRLVLSAALLAMLCAAPVASGQIHDNAGIFSDAAKQEASANIQQLHDKHGRSLLIETYTAVPADKQAELEEKGAKFYGDWAAARGRAESVNGIVVLIVLNPGHLQVDIGNETSKKLFTAADRKEMLPGMTEALKQKKYDEVLTRTAKFVSTRMDENSARRSTATTLPAKPTGAGGSSGPVLPGGYSTSNCGVGGIGSLLCIGVAVLVVVMVLRGIFSNRQNTGGGYPQGGPGPGGYGPGQGGYGPGYGPGPARSGGGFGSGLLGGLLGGAVGGWAANRAFGQHPSGPAMPGGDAGGQGVDDGGLSTPPDTSFSGEGSDFGSSADSGGGSDFGSSDSGAGGDSGGGSDF